MKILSIDTASNVCGVSIIENCNLLCKLDVDTGKTHSENLMPMIKTAFEQTNLTLNNIDLIVCDKGPGSFTGIRIGIATAKAFSDSLNIKCIGICSLMSLAYNVTLINKYGTNYTGLVCSLIDCKNSSCYFALYEFKNGICSIVIKPSSDTIDNIFKLLAPYNNILFVGDGSTVYKNEITNNILNCSFVTENLLNSYSLGIAGFKIYQQTNTDGDFDITPLPLYIKKPQAQRQLELKLGITDCVDN